MINERDYNDEMNRIIMGFKNSLLILVFEELVTSGLLNEFKPNLKITDRMLLPKDSGPKKDKRKQLLKEMFDTNKDAWLDSYYYLTNNKFRNLEKIRVEKQNNSDPKNKYKELDYFDLTKDQEWTVFYAMDWISQISFFQHYIYIIITKGRLFLAYGVGNDHVELFCLQFLLLKFEFFGNPDK